MKSKTLWYDIQNSYVDSQREILLEITFRLKTNWESRAFYILGTQSMILSLIILNNQCSLLKSSLQYLQFLHDFLLSFSNWEFEKGFECIVCYLLRFEISKYREDLMKGNAVRKYAKFLRQELRYQILNIE